MLSYQAASFSINERNLNSIVQLNGLHGRFRPDRKIIVDKTVVGNTEVYSVR